MATRVSALPGVQTAATAADTDILAIEDGTDAKQFALGELREYVTLGHGQIAVTTADGAVAITQCNADGSTDDRADILTALETARDSMPAVVEFGAGIYAMSNGINLYPAQGESGLTIKGQGLNVTQLKITGASALSNYHIIKIAPGDGLGAESDPSPKDTVSQYLNDIHIKDIGFYDDDPYVHQSRSGDLHTGTATGGSSTTMTVSGTPFTASALIGEHIANTTDESVGKITANTTSSVTFAYLGGGTTNAFAASDGFEITTLASGVEESHAISIQFATNASITNCSANGIGDEAFNFSFVQSGDISNNTLVNCPSIATGGAGIMVQHGCNDITVNGNRCRGSATKGTIGVWDESSACGVEVLDTYPATGISFSNNHIRDYGGSAIGLSSVSDGLSYVTITGNTIDNCKEGISKVGDSHEVASVAIGGNAFNACTEWGVIFDTSTIANTREISIDNNIFNNCTTGGVSLRASSTTLTGNTFKTCERGILINNGSYINILGGIFDGCGGTSLEEIEDLSSTSTSKASNVLVVNSIATSATFKGVNDLNGCIIRDSATDASGNSLRTAPQQVVLWPKNVVGCEFDGGVVLNTTSTHGVVANNHISYVPTSGAQDGLYLAGGNDDYVISGNTIDLTGGASNSYCIQIASGATNTLVIGNNIKSKTAGVANSFSDSGTGTIADFTNNNITT